MLPKFHLIEAIQRDKDLRVRWLLSNFDFGKLFGHVFKKTLELNNIKMAKAIAWVITNSFFIRYRSILHLIKFRIWPGFRCICNKKDVAFICSNLFEIIIESTRIEKVIPRKFAGFIVRQIPYEKDSKEARVITSRLSEYWKTDVCCDNIVIPGRKAESLFDNHSNLTLICSSVIRSKGMPFNHKLESVQCIQLYCTFKGVIPVGESHFPSSVCHYPTDVIEGCPVLATQIKIGDKVGTTDSLGQFKSNGTLGGFLKHLGFSCFLTCAHVVFDLETLLGRIPNDIDNKGIDVFTPSPHNAIPIRCGRVLRRVFEHSDKDKTSIDAALVNILDGVTGDPHSIVDHFGFSRPFTQLDYLITKASNKTCTTVTCDSKLSEPVKYYEEYTHNVRRYAMFQYNKQLPFYIAGLTSIDLNEICIDISSICNSKADVLCPGGFLRIKDKVKITPQEDYFEVQFPVAGGPVQPGYSQPLMIATTAHMQLRPGNLAGQRVFRMYNQLLLNLPLNLGDSGTCIYIIDDNKRKGCIGMAIAFLSAGQCIITPLKEILNKIKH
ncbi:unnamed protein product [Mytilus coruscus]|uniref:Uncharacterized protein n=1 Tax=Mytilus coruscus TaxID=42192 RepID=A0A6J8F1X7_MYTCO|nr:unnamed protein product [Mytilus coruscus]